MLLDLKRFRQSSEKLLLALGTWRFYLFLLHEDLNIEVINSLFLNYVTLNLHVAQFHLLLRLAPLICKTNFLLVDRLDVEDKFTSALYQFRFCIQFHTSDFFQLVSMIAGFQRLVLQLFRYLFLGLLQFVFDGFFALVSIVQHDLPVLILILLLAQMLLYERVNRYHRQFQSLRTTQQIQYKLVNEHLAVLLMAEESVEIFKFLFKHAFDHHIYCLAYCEGNQVHDQVLGRVYFGQQD